MRKILFLLIIEIFLNLSFVLSSFCMTRTPIVYSPEYNINLWKVICEEFPSCDFPFVEGKRKLVYEFLVKELKIQPDFFYTPKKISDDEMTLVHTKEYLESLSYLGTEEIIKIPLPDYKNLNNDFLEPMRYMTAGTILACNLALEYGLAINLGGGFHHVKADEYGGFCVFADIPLAVYKILKKRDNNFKILIVDLDAHQGNGYESIFENGIYKSVDKRIFIFDMYTQDNYPRDHEVKKYIDFNYPLALYTNTKTYLEEILKKKLPEAIQMVKPNLIIYNAGMDPYERDRLGKLKVSREGLILRDAFVVDCAKKEKIPIAILFGGSYSNDSIEIIQKSLENILKMFGVTEENKI